MATYPVKWMTDEMRGAPPISGTAGALVTALDAFLVDGWGQVSVTDIVVADGIATATVGSGDWFADQSVVLIAGASPAELNGEHRVLSHTDTTFTFATNASNGTATGTITAKYAPVGQWAVEYSDGNKRVYRSTDPAGARFCYRVDDSGTQYARVRGYEQMTDVDTGTGPFPTDAQISGGGYAIKSSAANGTAVPYLLVADSRTVYFAIAAGRVSNPNYTATAVRGFGDMLPLARAPDPWSAAVSCLSSTSSSDTGYGAFSSVLYQTRGLYSPRAASGLGAAVFSGSAPYVGTRGLNTESGADDTLGALADAPDGRLFYSRRMVLAGKVPRADVPGVFHVPQTGLLDLIPPGSIIAGTGELDGRQLYVCPLRLSNGLATGAPNGACLIDITGPWWRQPDA